MEILKKECPYCEKIIESLYPKQLEYNYQAHVISCKIKINQKKENEKKPEIDKL